MKSLKEEDDVVKKLRCHSSERRIKRYWTQRSNWNHHRLSHSSMFLERYLHVEDPLAEFGNCWGHISLWSASLFLWSVTLRSRNDNWYRYLHIWPGRVVVWASVLHGVIHMYRWKFILQKSLIHQLVPAWTCWAQALRSFRTTSPPRPVPPNDCHGTDILGCSCYDLARNGVGFLAWLGMLVIGCTSLETIRRRYFGAFYWSHILASLVVTLGTCLHFTRTMVYIAPSLLYYVSYSFPVWLEMWRNQSGAESREGIRILSCERIATHNPEIQSNDRGACISLVVEATEAALERYQPGQHIRLHVPALSRLSHPFTANLMATAPSSSSLSSTPQLRIVFRETGEFTTQLGQQLVPRTVQTNGSGDAETTPAVYMSGFYGCTTRVADALSHDHIVFVAGGVGIVAYLSLISVLLSSPWMQSKSITLLWICREGSLIDFVRREYMEAWSDRVNGNVTFHISIYHTGGSDSHSAKSDPSLARDSAEDRARARKIVSSPLGHPFVPITFAATRAKNVRVGLCERLLVYGILSGIGGSMVTLYACANALNETDPAATVWSWVCVFSIVGCVIWSGATMDIWSFATFSATMWVGLFVIWFAYLDLQDEFSRMGTRLVSPLVITALAALISGLYTFIPVLRHHHTKYSLIAVSDLPDGTEMSALEPKCKMGDESTLSDDKPAVNMATFRGRPSLRDVLNPLLDVKRLGVFTCGPSTLMQDVRSVVHKLSRRDICSNRPCRIAVYEESFET
jgi:predicted ferric reductase